MCDTILAPLTTTAKQVTLFGKNSDRGRNEAQILEYRPRSEHANGSELRCTYITIPQARRTHAVLLSRPFWIWGAEMGANEFGVVIGNEAVQARGAAPEAEALLGMDLLRLGLERGETAEEAVSAMAKLLETHGQGGNCGHLKIDYYSNSFIVADATSAFVLETVGREWLVERVSGVRTISNIYSIGRNPHRVSLGLARLLRDSSWTTDPSPDYAEVIADPETQHIGEPAARRARSTQLLTTRMGRLTVADMIAALRDHNHDENVRPDWHPTRERKRTLCMHAGVNNAPSQTTGSLVSEISASGAVHWVTATAAPCISIFKPALLGTPLPEHGPPPADKFDSRALWWRHERLHRAAVLANFGELLDAIRSERDALEADFRARVGDVTAGGDAADRAAVVADCWREAAAMEERWLARVDPSKQLEDGPYTEGWATMNRLAGIDLTCPSDQRTTR
jgi:secernin